VIFPLNQSIEMSVKVGIVGYGYWGKNLVRNFNGLDTCTIKYVCENHSENAKKCAKLYPNLEVVPDYTSLLNDADLDAIIIATPVDTHFDLAKSAMEAGKHVLVEKPMTSDAPQARELMEIAERLNLTLMVDHTFLYTGAVQHMKELVEGDTLGNIQYIDSTRINLGLFQRDINVLWDLAPHDISICQHLIGKKPISVQAVGVSHTGSDLENIAYLTLKYEDDMIAHFNCSWVSPVKIRQMLVGGDKKMIVFDDNQPTEKVKIYDTGYEAKTAEEVNQIKIDYRTGDIHVPKLPITEALALMASDFITAITTGKKPESDAALGVAVVEILAAAQESIKSNSEVVL
jgi:predicted dehydrogenase